MKFILNLSLFFSAIYAFVAVHYVSFDKNARQNELQNLSAMVKDVRLSTSFIQDEYERFVYDK